MPRPLFLAGESRASNDVREIKSPYDGRVVSEVCCADSALLAEAIDRCAAPPRWPAWQRARILDAAARETRRRREEITGALVAECGKPVAAARIEAARAVDTFTDAAFAARGLGGEIQPLDSAQAGEGRIALQRRFPIGPVAAITPFNFPFNLAVHKVAPAIAAGCPVVLKPASQTPTTALLLAEILRDAGLPAGALSVLPMAHDTAAPLATDPRFRLLTFTGSAEVGWELKRRANHMRVALELGGNAGNIVCADADLDLAVEKLTTGAFAFAGQSCISVQRIFVARPLFESFREKIVARVERHVRWGDPRDEEVVVGPLITRGDAERVMEWIAEATDQGATLLCGGGRHDSVVEPTLLGEPDPALRVVEREVFGPVACLLPFDEIEEAFEQVNRSSFGLQAGIFTESVDAALRAHEALDVGGIVHNDASAFRVDAMPYGGVKESGTGREGPRHAVHEYTEPRLLVLKRG